MNAPPVLPRRPPPLPSQRQKVPTFIYLGLFVLFLSIDVIWVFAKGNAQSQGNLAFAIGMVTGGVVLPLGLVVGITHIWKVNRGSHGVARVLFWASLAMLILKLNQIANHRPRSQPVPEQEQRTELRESGRMDSAVLSEQPSHGDRINNALA